MTWTKTHAARRGSGGTHSGSGRRSIARRMPERATAYLSVSDFVSPTLHHTCEIVDDHITINGDGTVVLSRLRVTPTVSPTRSLITMAHGTSLVSKPNSRMYCSHSFPSRYANTKVFFICGPEEPSLLRSRAETAPGASARRTERSPRSSRD